MNRQTIMFDISPVFPIKEELAKDTFRFCLNAAKALKYKKGNGLTLPKRMKIRMRRGAYWRLRSGHATKNYRGNHSAEVFLCLSDGVPPHWDVYARYEKCPDVPRTWIEDGMEMFVHLIAHELGHAIFGFDGDKVGEYQCERLGAEILDMWRAHHRPAAILI